MEALYYINPVDDSLQEYLLELPEDSFGKSISIRTSDLEIEIPPESIVIVGVPEDRNAVNNPGTGLHLTSLRKELYKFYSGNWHVPVFDLGDIRTGAGVEDTGSIVRRITHHCISNKIIPIFIGGSHAITYDLYRSYDDTGIPVNLSLIDPLFDLGKDPAEFHSRSFLHRIILEEPHNLANLTHLGYQTFANSQNEIELMKKLMFDIYRLGEIKHHIELSEAVLRESHIVSLDLGAVRRSDAPGNNNGMVSGFTGDEICSIARYAGLTHHVQVFGIFEYNERYDRDNITAGLAAQIIWYFIEGINYRIEEYPAYHPEEFKKYMVPVDDNTLIFIKSNRTGRWWINILTEEDNNIKKYSLVPCTYRDYLSATSGEVPEVWYKNRILKTKT